MLKTFIPLLVVHAGCVLRSFKIIATLVLSAQDKLQREEEARKMKAANDEKLAATLAAIDDPEPKTGDCGICGLVKINTYCVPCGHTCSNVCWQKNHHNTKKK